VKNKTTPKLFAYKVVAKTGKAVLSLPGLKGTQDKMRNKLYKSAGATDYVNASSEVMKETFKKTIDEDLKDSIGQIVQPSLVIWGDKDKDTPVSNLKYYRENPNMTVHLLAGGHYIFLDQPTEVKRLVKEFL